MALVAVAADKGAPGVTTASLALAAVWPRPVLLAECDAAGGDLFYRLPAAGGGRLDPQRGLLSLAVAARRGIQPHQVWRHTQKLDGGLDILTGLVNTEQAAGLASLWGEVGKLLAEVPEVDVIADCGRLGADGPFYDLLAQSSAVVLVARVTLEDVVRLRDRVIAVSQGLANRTMPGAPIGVVIVADRKNFKRHIAEAGQALARGGVPARILGGLANEPKTAHMLRGRWSTKLDGSLLIRTARELAGNIARDLPAPGALPGPGAHSPGWWQAGQRAAQSPGAALSQPGQVPLHQVPAGQAAAGSLAAGVPGAPPEYVPRERVAVVGPRPARQLPAGPGPAGQGTGRPAVVAAAGQVLPGQVLPGQVLPGQVLPAKAPGQMPPGEVLPRRVPRGRAPSGQPASGQVPAPSQPPVPPPAPVPYHAEHVAPLRLARGPEPASTGPEPVVRLPQAEPGPGAGAPHGTAGQGTNPGPGQGTGSGQGANGRHTSSRAGG